MAKGYPQEATNIGPPRTMMIPLYYANLPPALAGLNRSTIRERTDSAVVRRANAEHGYRE